jgi:hypothetical protein
MRVCDSAALDLQGALWPDRIDMQTTDEIQTAIPTLELPVIADAIVGPGGRYMTKRQTIESLNTTERTFDRMAAEDGGPPRIRWGIGKRKPQLLYSREGVLKWIESRTEKRRRPRTKK